MVESSNTPVSPISGGSRGSARDAVAGFLRYTVDTPDLEKAKLHLTRRSVASGSFDAAAVPPGSTYTLGAEEADELGRRIPVSVRSPGPTGAAQEMTVQVVVMEEEGAWKIDLPATMDRMFGGAMNAMGEALGAMGQAMAGAMAGVSQALTAGMGMSEPEFSEGQSAPVEPASRPVRRAGKAGGGAGAVRRGVKSASPSVKKAVKRVIKASAKVAKRSPAAGKRKKSKPAARKVTRIVRKKKATPITRKKRR